MWAFGRSAARSAVTQVAAGLAAAGKAPGRRARQRRGDGDAGQGDETTKGNRHARWVLSAHHTARNSPAAPSGMAQKCL